MALGIVPDDVFEKEVEQYLNGHVIEKVNRGRPENALNVPETLKRVLGDTAIEAGLPAATELAKTFGVSRTQVNEYSNGQTGRFNPDHFLTQHINKTKQRIAKKAAGVTKRALMQITDEKLEQSSAPELASVARAAAAIVKDMTPESSASPNSQTVQFVIHRPARSEEKNYPVIDIESVDS